MTDEKLQTAKKQALTRNCFIFNHHNEPQPAEFLHYILKRPKGQGYDTICIEGVPPEVEITNSFIQTQVLRRSQIDSTIHKRFGALQSKISEFSLDSRLTLYQASGLSKQNVTFQQFVTNEGLLAFWKAIETADKLGFNLVGIDFNVSKLSRQKKLLDFGMRETRMCKLLSDLNNQGKNCIIMLGVAHLPGMVQHLKKQTVENQRENLLTYVYQSGVVLDPNITKKQWFKDLRDKSKHAHTSKKSLTVHPFHVESKEALARLIRTVLSHVENAGISKSLLETNISFFDTPPSDECLSQIITKEESRLSLINTLFVQDDDEAHSGIKAR